MGTQPVSKKTVNLYISSQKSKPDSDRKNLDLNIDGLDWRKNEFITMSIMDVTSARGDLKLAIEKTPNDKPKIDELKQKAISTIDTVINQADDWNKKLGTYYKVNWDRKNEPFDLYRIYTDDPKAKVKETFVLLRYTGFASKTYSVFPLDCGYSNEGIDTYNYLQYSFQSKEEFFKTIKAGYKVNEVQVGDIGVDNNKDGKLDLDADGKKILDGKSDVYYNPVKIIYTAPNNTTKVINSAPHDETKKINLIKEYSQLGVDEANKKDFSKAIEYFQKAYNLDPQNKISKENLQLMSKFRGVEYVDAKKYSLAITDLSLALKLNPNDSQTQKLLGSTYALRGHEKKEQGKIEEAIKDYEQAIKLDVEVELLKQVISKLKVSK